MIGVASVHHFRTHVNSPCPVVNDGPPSPGQGAFPDFPTMKRHFPLGSS